MPLPAAIQLVRKLVSTRKAHFTQSPAAGEAKSAAIPAPIAASRSATGSWSPAWRISIVMNAVTS